MNFTISEENYLKAIYHLQGKKGNVSTKSLAEKLQTTPASVTDMMKKLSSKKLLHYKPYYGFSLSKQGEKNAVFIIRRHRLWEYFLSEKLKFNWNEVHLLAEELEHVSSKPLINRLDEYLGFPQADPHGDPIPDQKGKMKNVKKISLNHLSVNTSAEVVQVANQTKELLQLLQHKKITIGTKLEVRKHFGFDNSIELKIKNTTVTISGQLAKNIFVTYGTNASPQFSERRSSKR